MKEYILKVNETYTYNIYHNYFSSHLPIITTDSVGGSRTGEISLGVTNTWQTSSGKIYTGDVVYDSSTTEYESSDGTLRVYTNDGSLREPFELQKIKITFTPTSTGTYYLQDSRVEYAGVKLTVQDDYGDFLNPEELYHTLFLRRSNRLYEREYSDDVFERFIESYIPAGLRARTDNLAPVITGWINNKSFYSPGDTIVMSPIIDEPESDILTYLWENQGMRTVSGIYYTTTVSGIDMTVPLLNVSGVTCSGVLPTPPVETLFRFQLTTEDSDNTTIGTNTVPVYSLPSGFRFTAWSGEDFMFGDADLPFSYYPDSGWVPDNTKPTAYTQLRFFTSVDNPRGYLEMSIISDATAHEGLTRSPLELDVDSVQTLHSGLEFSQELQELECTVNTNISGVINAATEHEIEVNKVAVSGISFTPGSANVISLTFSTQVT